MKVNCGMQVTQKSHVIAEEAVAHKYTLSEINHISELTLWICFSTKVLPW